MTIRLKKLLVKEQELQPGVSRRAINSDAYLVTLRNDASGQNQLDMIRKSLGGEYIVKPRGRHHNRKELLGTKYKPGSNNEVPIEQAEFLAVYLYPKQ